MGITSKVISMNLAGGGGGERGGGEGERLGRRSGAAMISMHTVATTASFAPPPEPDGRPASDLPAAAAAPCSVLTGSLPRLAETLSSCLGTICACRTPFSSHCLCTSFGERCAQAGSEERLAASTIWASRNSCSSRLERVGEAGESIVEGGSPRFVSAKSVSRAVSRGAPQLPELEPTRTPATRCHRERRVSSRTASSL